MAFQRKKPEPIGIKAKYPGFIQPALATAVDKAVCGALIDMRDLCQVMAHAHEGEALIDDGEMPADRAN